MRHVPDRALSDLGRIQEILFGDILSELERRLDRTDGNIVTRTHELKEDVRARTDVLEAHVRKETDAITARSGHDVNELTESIRDLRREHREALTLVDQRVARLEERVEASIARVERETRQQLLDQAKSFLDQLERSRHQLRATIARELDMDAGLDEEVSQSDAEARTASQ